MDVVGSARNGLEGVDLVLAKRPEIVLMDLNMPEMGGLEATRRILNEFPTCILVLTAYSDEETAQAAFDAGASGFLTKPIDSKCLANLMLKALKESDCLSPRTDS